MPSYSGAAREILLRPTLRFPGIIGPKLEFSTHTSFDEIMDCSCHCCDIHRVHCESDIYQRGRRSRRPNTFSEQYESADKSWNEPPFVVRKVDDNLLSRSPSLFQSGKMCSYCCKSPHRHSNCAACRFKRIQSPSPIRLKPNRNRSYVKQDNYCTYCKHAERHLKSDCKLCETQSDNPKIVANVVQESPISNSPRVESKSVDRTRLSSNTSTVQGSGSPDVARLKSPIFDRPSYLERYGTSPVNPSANRNTNVAESDETIVEVRQNDKVNDDHSSCHNCWCHSHLGHLSSPHLNCCYNCSSYECPLFWRYRFGSPYNFYNWRAFHHGLTRVYDDLYKDYV